MRGTAQLQRFVVVALLAGAAANPGCSCNKSTSGTDLAGVEDLAAEPDSSVVEADGGCIATGDSCQSSTSCCSGVCDGTKCVVGACAPDNAPCTNNTDCCGDSYCNSGKCFRRLKDGGIPSGP